MPPATVGQGGRATTRQRAADPLSLTGTVRLNGRGVPTVVVPQTHAYSWPGFAAKLVQLLTRKAIPNLKLGPEELLTVQIADRLRALSIGGRLSAVWTHVGNEFQVSSKMFLARLVGGKRKAMGVIAGAGDFVFTWPGGGGWIEIKLDSGDTYIAVRAGKTVIAKRPATQLSQDQRLFRDWCTALGIPHRTARSLAEVEAILREWGRLP